MQYILNVSYNDGSLSYFEYNDKDKDFSMVYRWSNGTLYTYGGNDETKEEAYSEEKALELIATLRPKE